MITEIIEKAGLAAIRDRYLLVARNSGSGLFQIPGGKIERGDQDALAALIREVREELGIVLARDDTELLGVFSAPAAGKPGKTVRVTLFAAPLVGKPRAQNEVAELLWIDLNQPTPRPLSAVVADQIIPFLKAR